MSRALGIREAGCVRIAYPHVRTMRTFWSRARGLIGRKRVSPDCAYLFPFCPSVHTHFMQTAIDVIVCDRHMGVLAVATMQPGCTSSPKARGARTVIEAAPGTAIALGIEAGCQLCTVR